MFDSDNKKKKTLTLWAIVSIVLLIIIIIFYNQFSEFFIKIKNILAVINSIFIGGAIAYILNPLEQFFSRHVFKKMKTGKWHKSLSILCTYLLIIGIIIMFFVIIIPQLSKSISELPGKLKLFINDLSIILNDWMVSFQRSDFYKSIIDALGVEKLDLNKAIESFIGTFINIEQIISGIANSSVELIGNVYSAAANTIIGFVLSIYLLSAKSRLTAQGKMLSTAVLGEDKANKFFGILKLSDRTFGSFIQGKIINSFITGMISGIVFSIFGLPYPVLLGVIVGVTDIIPVFGPFIGGIPCAFLVLIAAPEKLLLFAILIIVIQQFDGNYIAPKILGESTGLSSLGVFIAIIVMGGYFGLIGMIIGVPLFAVIFVLIKTSVEKKLASRGLSTDIYDYYANHSDDLMDDGHKSYFKKVFDFIFETSRDLIKKIADLISRCPKIVKKQKASQENNNTQNDNSKEQKNDRK